MQTALTANGSIHPRLCEETVRLLDKLRRSALIPFVMESNVNNATISVFSRLNVDDLKNESGGPFVCSRVRIFTTAALAAAASASVFNNISVKIVDNDRHQVLTKEPSLLPVLVSRRDNTWTLDRPHVIASEGSWDVAVQEEGVDGTTDIYVAFLGETVLGDMTAAEVRRAVGLGIYPGFRGRYVGWSMASFVAEALDGPCETEKGEMLRLALRLRVAQLSLKLSEAHVRPIVLEASADNLANGSLTDLPSAPLRNDSGQPLAITRAMACTVAARAAAAATSVFNNVSFEIVRSDEKKLTWRPVLAPCLFDIRNNTWLFERPMVVEPGGSVEARVFEEAVGATTDVHFSLHGFMVEGLSTSELQECISLGLFTTWERRRR